LPEEQDEVSRMNASFSLLARMGDEATDDDALEGTAEYTGEDGGEGLGWLYIHVAASTVEAPIMKEGVIVKSNSTTDARKESMIERDVAKPLRMLSEYLITMAVISPPRTWMATVAQAQKPKLRNRSRMNPREPRGGAEYE